MWVEYKWIRITRSKFPSCIKEIKTAVYELEGYLAMAKKAHFHTQSLVLTTGQQEGERVNDFKEQTRIWTCVVTLPPKRPASLHTRQMVPNKWPS